MFSYTERNVEELVCAFSKKSIFPMSYRSTYAVYYIHEPQAVWAETAEREAYAVIIW